MAYPNYGGSGANIPKIKKFETLNHEIENQTPTFRKGSWNVSIIIDGRINGRKKLSLKTMAQLRSSGGQRCVGSLDLSFWRYRSSKKNQENQIPTLRKGSRNVSMVIKTKKLIWNEEIALKSNGTTIIKSWCGDSRAMIEKIQICRRKIKFRH